MEVSILKFKWTMTPEYKALGRAVEAYVSSSSTKLSEKDGPDFKLYVAYLIAADNAECFEFFLGKFTDDVVKSLASKFSKNVSEDGILITDSCLYFRLELARRKLRKRNKYYFE